MDGIAPRDMTPEQKQEWSRRMAEIRRVKKEEKERRLREEITRELVGKGKDRGAPGGQGEGGERGAGAGAGGAAQQRVERLVDGGDMDAGNKQHVREVGKMVKKEMTGDDWYETLDRRQKSEFHVLVAQELMQERMYQRNFDMATFIQESIDAGVRKAVKRNNMSDLIDDWDEEEIDAFADYLADREIERMKEEDEEQILKGLPAIQAQKKEEKRREAQRSREEEHRSQRYGQGQAQNQVSAGHRGPGGRQFQRAGGGYPAEQGGGYPPPRRGSYPEKDQEAAYRERYQVPGDQYRSGRAGASAPGWGEEEDPYEEEEEDDGRAGYDQYERYPPPPRKEMPGSFTQPNKGKAIVRDFDPKIPPVNEFHDPFANCF